MATSGRFPAASLTIDYPEHSNRLTCLFRILLAIPILIILGLLLNYEYSTSVPDHPTVVSHGIGLVVVPALLFIVFRQKYPRWWFDWNLSLLRFSARVFSYLLLLRDEYPSVDAEQAVHLDITYPDARQDLNRWLPLVKWFLALPHFVLLFLLSFTVVAVSVVAWFAVVITGQYPRPLFDFVVGVMRWSLRVFSYAIVLTTDRYPPFSLDE